MRAWGWAVTIVVLGLAADPARAQDPLTPAGPSTVMDTFTGAVTAEGRPPMVLVSWTATVGPGSRAGVVALRAATRIDPRGTLVGEPVTLPAAPGSYTFPAPNIRWDSRFVRLGLDQATGGHALLSYRSCNPMQGAVGDPCQVFGLDVFAGLPARNSGPASERRPGASLTIVGNAELDADQDLAGDVTQDRTDLRLRARQTGRRSIRLSIANRGPRSADLPRLETSGVDPSGVRWNGDCRGRATGFGVAPPRPGQSVCRRPVVPAGRTRTMSLTLGPGAPRTVRVRVTSEGPDLRPADNATTITLRPARSRG